ncbi:MAG: tetratricopeptide repeat protein [Bacteroidetes bacterium]|nr:tetratricopeptide repeat protein [Bacteroidota bacterium]
MRRTQFHDNPKLAELVHKFEEASEKGQSVFFEPNELSDLIDYYESEFLPNRALEVCQFGASQYPYTPTFHLRQAMIMLDSGQDEGILDLLDQAEILSPISLEPKLLRAEALASVGRFLEAGHILKNLEDKATTSEELSQIYYFQALVCEKQEQFGQMFQLLEKALREDPNNEEALDRMWVSVELSKKYEESIRIHEELIDKEPYSYKAWYNLGHAYSYCGRYEDAADAFEYSYLVNENFEYAYRDCAEICFETQNFIRALQCYSEVMDRFEADSDLLLRIGQCYLGLDQPETARRFFQQAIRIDPLSDESFFHLGECQMEAGEYKVAIQTFKRAIRVEDRREEYFAALAEAYYQTDDLEKADLHFQTAIELAPESTEHWLRYATFLLDTDRLREGFEILDQAEEHAVGTELQYCRVGFLLAANERPEALFLLEEALTDDFDLHPELFKLLPELEADPEVRAVINTFRPLED